MGKTFLIKTFFKSALCFQFTGVQNQPMKAQLKAFAHELGNRQNCTISPARGWIEAFWALRNYVETLDKNTKKVLFFDELTWVDTPKSGFIQIFAHFWNSWAAWEGNIILVIAGSSTSWIINKIYNDRGGFHNRVTKRIWLKPFDLCETEAFLRHKNIFLNRYEITLLHMALGGVPYYLNEVRIGENAAQCLQRLCFMEGSLLQDEFENLYSPLVKQPDSHLKIVSTLVQHRYGLKGSELLKKTNLSDKDGSPKILDELVENGYLRYMVPFGKKYTDGTYILADFYSLFYLTFIYKQKNLNWNSQVNSPAYFSWCDQAFGLLCHTHKPSILKALGINGILTSTTFLPLKDENRKITAQIDMLIDRADNWINLCEIKFANDVHVMAKEESEAIRKKVWAFGAKLKRRKSISPIMITPFGCEKNMYYLGLMNNQLTLDDLFVGID